jgi:polyphosphate kinase 2 (PPK2 family)
LACIRRFSAPRGIPEKLLAEKTFWQGRYLSIVDFEAHIHRNGTRIIKFCLHLSREKQRKRFLECIDKPKKNWKFSQRDIEERTLREHYPKAYEVCLSQTSTKHGPWYVVPADDKENARLIISRVILDMLKELEMGYPEPT